jgi:hypothetical protein
MVNRLARPFYKGQGGFVLFHPHLNPLPSRERREQAPSPIPPDVIAIEANAERGNLRSPQPSGIASSPLAPRNDNRGGIRDRKEDNQLCTPDKSGNCGF